ncbi:MAG TPA: thiol reductant ABC exporter subunit CydC [Devosia sp.]|jgi:ATP-binding cassette subfamily C protein CydC|uniref:thiol reductant ABC exporter subunit CydC n=1 Tax=Devosia sp. TaxID=1871048 RepID=UPI002DDD7E30|nr:thiol reductant ABC exporter subunit CydC [Devosia sp.]HEV2516022.1 thiol reductant ABC exporter subunit CydC [Devosia sp.]
MKAILAFAPLLGRLKGPILLTVLLSLVTLFAGIGLLGLSGWFLTAAALSTLGSAFNIFAPSAGVRGLSFIRILSRYGEKLSGHDMTLRLLSDLRAWLFAKLFPLVPLARRYGRGDLVSRLLADVEALDTVFLVALGPISTAVLAGAAMTVVLAIFLPGAALLYGLLVFAAVLLVPIGLVLASRAAGAEVVAAGAALRQAVLDGIDGHQDLVLFGAIDQATNAAATASQQLSHARRRLGLRAALAAALVQLLAGGALIGTLLAGLAAREAGAIDGPLLAGLLLAVIASFEASAMLVRSATRLAGAAAAADRLQAIANTAPAVTEPAAPLPIPEGGELRFEAVRFGYDPQHPVLDGLSFAVRTGECLAIVGPSGAGKSTIAQLLLRLVDPDAGTVRLNGSDLRDAAGAELRQRIVLMTQDAPVFLDSIRANLSIGRADAGDDELWRVLDAVRLAQFVRGLPGQLDTLVGEAGRTLSAGQARRICLARTLLSRADVIVFDEPTSGLDAETEAAFLAELPELTRGRTAIVITHAVVPETFDRVLELRAGRLE